MDARQARVVIAKLTLELHKLAAQTVPGGRPDMVLIARVLFVAGRPLTASQIARSTGLSRQTALRRLDEMCETELVARANCRFSLIYEGMNRRYPLDRAVKLILKAASELSNLDTNPLRPPTPRIK